MNKYHIDYWYKHKEQIFNIGDWFYLTQKGTLKKVNNQIVINIKLGIKITSICDMDRTAEVIYKIYRIKNDIVFFLTKENMKIIR